MAFHHRIDPYPMPKNPIYVNEPWIIDEAKAVLLENIDDPKNYTDSAPDNVRVFLPLDINRETVLRRLSFIIGKYGEANEENEFHFELEVSQLLSQVEIYDQIHFARNGGVGNHSEEGRNLVREFVKELKEIPDGCAERFPFEMIDELEAEYNI